MTRKNIGSHGENVPHPGHNSSKGNPLNVTFYGNNSWFLLRCKFPPHGGKYCNRQGGNNWLS